MFAGSFGEEEEVWWSLTGRERVTRRAEMPWCKLPRRVTRRACPYPSSMRVLGPSISGTQRIARANGGASELRLSCVDVGKIRNLSFSAQILGKFKTRALLPPIVT